MQTLDQTIKPSHKSKRRIPILILLAIAVISALVFAWNQLHQSPANVLRVSGRVEGYETNIGPKIGGRIDMIKYREGDIVKRGELIVQISDADVQAQLCGAEARIKKAGEQLEEAKYKLKQVQTQVESGRIRVQQSTEESQGRIAQWQSTLSMDKAKVCDAEAQLAQAKADFELAKIRKERYAFLVSKLAVTKDEYDEMSTSCTTAQAVVASKQANVEAAQRMLKADQAQIKQAQSTRMNAPMNEQELQGSKRQLQQAQHEYNAAVHEIENALAARDEIKANIDYLNIRSPIDGVVTARAVEPGAVAVPGQTLLSIINLNEVYLRAYVPEGQIDKVHIGEKAKIFLDGRPNDPLEGTVIQVDPQGSFTPENIYFKNDRVRQVFGIKVSIQQAKWYAKPGMPADAEIAVN